MTRTTSKSFALIEQSLAGQYFIEPLEVPESPVFLANAWPLSDGITGVRPRLPSGRGTSLQGALFSAGAEALELRASLAQNHLNELAHAASQAGHATVMAKDLLRGDEVQVSAQHVYLDCAVTLGEEQVHNADSTGCATGMSRQSAIIHAVLECVERDGMALWWYGELQRPALPIALLDQTEPRLGWWLQTRHRRTTLLDLTVEGGAPIVLAFSAEPDGTRIAIGVAARFSIVNATLAAVTEMLQTEVSLNLAATAGDEAATSWIATASTRNLIQFQPLPETGPHAANDMDIDRVLQHLAYDDLQVLCVDLSLPDDPLPTVRVLVPGFCAMSQRLEFKRFQGMTGKPASAAFNTIIEPF